MRDNLLLGVEQHLEAAGKDAALVARVREMPGAGIVYAATRRRCEELAAILAGSGCTAAAYHAGMASRARRAVEDAFLGGATRAVVATTAFGAAAKPGVRFVLHAEVAESVDAYLQEIGCAGGDGEEGEETVALLYYCPEDLGVRRFFAGAPQVRPEAVRAVAAALADRPGGRPGAELALATRLAAKPLSAVLGQLEEIGALETLAGDTCLLTGEADPDELLARLAERAEERRTIRQRRVETMRDYVETDRCRWQFLHACLGSPADEPCGCCDNCRPAAAA